MFLTALFADIDKNPYEQIGKYLDDGSQTLVTGNKQIEKDGQTIFYGPDVNFTKITTPEMVVIEFAEPLPKASLTRRCNAVVSRIEFEAGGDTYAVGSFGPITQRKKLQWGE